MNNSVVETNTDGVDVVRKLVTWLVYTLNRYYWYYGVWYIVEQLLERYYFY